MPSVTTVSAALGALLLVTTLAACSDSDADPGLGTDPRTGKGSDLALLDARGPCPEQLSEPTDDSGYGFGADAPAEESPDLPEVDRAWVCRYDATDRPGRNPDGAYYTWDRGTRPRQLPAAEVPALVQAVEGLVPPEGDQACTAELGPRYLVVLATPEGRVLAVSVDAFGCSDVRLTADPWGGAPGETPADGVPEGVLAGGAGVLDLLPQR